MEKPHAALLQKGVQDISLRQLPGQYLADRGTNKLVVNVGFPRVDRLACGLIGLHREDPGQKDESELSRCDIAWSHLLLQVQLDPKYSSFVSCCLPRRRSRLPAGKPNLRISPGALWPAVPRSGRRRLEAPSGCASLATIRSPPRYRDPDRLPPVRRKRKSGPGPARPVRSQV